ncbi:hypothetical protein LSH36_714g01001 [Paralvinella palmiformis]|uniref:Hydrolase RBBP9 n=1 Tax=Paralvinella palmiformis TaxID=53620 RepID=A0AAD9J1S3_9ANNE|nr:hypothetical protein LSH36_714g01001 [Paralvinella palmiformis]
MTQFVIVPGNGGGDVESSNWYAWARDKLKELPGVEVTLTNMPDPVLARKSVWVPFMHEKLHCSENTVIIGHSSGAEAAMRYTEKYKVKGIILVSACFTDLGSETEKVSGYYDDPWLWEEIKSNTDFIIQFGSEDDPFISFKSEQCVVAENLQSDFRKFSDRGHFMSSTFPELINTIKDLNNI